MPPLDYAAARMAGHRTYQGAPCTYGHDGIRYTGNRACVTCERINGAAWKRDNSDSEKARLRAWKRENRERHRDNNRAHRARRTPAQRAAVLAAQREYDRSDPNGRIAARRQANKAARDAARAARDAYRNTPTYQAEVAARRAAQREQQRARYAEKRRNRTPEQVAADCAREREKYQDRRRRDLGAVRAQERHARRLRRARMRNVASTATRHDETLALRIQGGACAYCGRTDDLHLDHKTPISRGGGHTPDNLQWLCAWHNMSKHDKTDAEYRAANGIPAVTQWDSLI